MVIGLVQPLVVGQVDGLGANQPEVPPDFGGEMPVEEFVERPRERLEVQRFVLAFLLGLEEVESWDLERVVLQEENGPRAGKVQSSCTGILEACPVLQ